MQCNTNYTVDVDKYEHVNLNVLDNYRKLYPDTILGLSDHTAGFTTILGAIAKGAFVIEKHFTDDNNRIGPITLLQAKFPVNYRDKQVIDIVLT